MPAKLALLAFAAASCFGQTTLRQYLNPTSAQAASLVRLDQDYQTYQNAQDRTASDLNNQLYNLFQQPAPDPLALGNAAAALENIRRDEAAKQSTLQNSATALLQPAQITIVQNLSAAATLLSLALDAQCAYLVQAPPSQWFDTSAIYPTISNSGFFYPYPSPPTIPPAPSASFCGSATFPISVRDYLSLTDPQVAVIFQASAAYNDFYLRQQNRLADLKQQAQDILAAGNADPVVLGLTYVESANINQQIRDKGSQLRDIAQSQLTPTQNLKLKTLQDAENLYGWGVINNAVSCNLLTVPIGTSDDGLSGGVCTLF